MEPAGGLVPLNPSETAPADKPFVGWRYWLFQPTTGHLGSVSHRRIEWHPGQPLQAVCLTGGHPAPSPGCACGIHASPDRRRLLEHGLCLAPGLPLVFGRVAVWGAVVTDDHGWRAQFAYPVELSVVAGTEGVEGTEPLLARLGQYGVAVGTAAATDAVGEVSAALLSFQAMSSGPSAPAS
ncbi:MAG: hypothetical protein KY439_03830 [Actinobacteria bacterium]|nr:hypothetical protein [Actinomycetota bacterium]